MILPRLADLGSERWLRAGLVLGVFALAAYLGLHSSNTYLFALLAAGGGVVLLKRPQLGYIGLLAAAMAVPFALGTGTQTELPLPFLLVPVLFAVWLLKSLSERRGVVPSSVNTPLAVFAACCVIAFISGNLPWNYFAGTASLAAQLGGLALFIFSPALLFVTANQIKDLRWLKALCALLLGFGVLGFAWRAVPALGPLTSRILTDRATDSLFWVWVVALSAGLALFDRGLRAHWRALLLALALSTLGAEWLLARSWVSGWLPPLVALVALVWMRSPRAGAGLTLLGLALLNIQYPELLGDLLQLKAYSIDTRIVAWQIMIDYVIPANPVLGLGPANYYFYTPLYPILGYYTSFNSHNQYLDIVAQVGLVGLAALGWLIVTIARVGWALRERVGDGFARGYVYACLGGLAGTLWAGIHGDWFIPFVYNIGIAGFRASMLPWLFCGGLIALERMTHREPAEIPD